MAAELFELSLLGGAYERRYRRLRPDVERLPWGSLDVAALDARTVERGRRFWTVAAFQEHRTGAACAATLEALIAARARRPDRHCVALRPRRDGPRRAVRARRHRARRGRAAAPRSGGALRS